LAEVLNQPPPLINYNLFDADAPLREALEREGGSWAHDMVRELGRLAGTEEAIDWASRPTRTHPSSTPMTGSAIASTRSSSTLHGIA
jgi:putative acyl-CoA dehydrogenase